MKKIYDHENFLKKCEDFSIVGATEIGVRDQNMDHTTYAIHPEFPNVKLLVLADGDSNAREGAAGAQFFCDYIAKQFNSLTEEDVTNIEETMKKMIVCADKYILSINKNYNKQCVTVGSFAIIVDNTLYNITIGDMSVYYKKGDEVERINNIRTVYDAYHLCGLSDEKIFKIEPDAKTLPYKKVGLGEIRKSEFVHIVENIDSVYIMSDGVSRHVSKSCKQEIFEKIHPNDVPKALVEVAQYGHTVSVDSIIDSGDVDISDDNLSVIGYVKENQKTFCLK